MSEFPFGEADDTAREAPTREGKALLIGGGLLAAVAVGVGAFLFLGGRGGGGDSVSAAPPPRSGVAAPVQVGPTTPTKPSPTPSPSALGLPAPTVEHAARNPFKALYVVPVAATAPGPGAAPTGVPGAPVGAPVPPAPPPAVPPTATTPAPVGDPTAPTLYAVKLLSISGSSASMVVDGKTMSIIVGQRFGRDGELVVLSIGRSSLVLQVAADTPLPFVIGQSRGVL